ncbi:MAG TPA: sugar phosphate isomerase/epimerase [Planctomycetaceae bacterium]|nr:sugar phosphate isomerase/epimerase [Planctomycetaceae bacterium]
MKMANRLAATTTSFAPYSLEEALEGIARAGYRFVELTAIRGIIEHVPLEAGPKDLGRVQRLLNRYALTPVALSAHSNLMISKGVKDAVRALDLCERLGIGIMNTAVGGAEETRENEAAFLANIGKLADYAAQRDITITIELHGDLTATGRTSRRLLKRVDRPNVRINYDTANCEYFGDTRAEDDLPFAVPWMGLCHLKDKIGGHHVWNFPALGRGHVDFKKLIGMLKRGRYTGPCSVEVEFQGNPWPSPPAVIKALEVSRRHLVRLGLS